MLLALRSGISSFAQYALNEPGAKQAHALTRARAHTQDPLPDDVAICSRKWLLSRPRRFGGGGRGGGREGKRQESRSLESSLMKLFQSARRLSD